MNHTVLEQIDYTLDAYAVQLPTHSLTRHAIMREDAWGDIASYARCEGFNNLAKMLEDAENLALM